MKKLVLITDSLKDPRISKRLNTLEEGGIEYELFGFCRNQDDSYPIKTQIIGKIGNLPYSKRFLILYKGIKMTLQKFNNDDNVVFYIFGLQIALIFSLITTRKPYIYEEADLVHTYIKSKYIKRFLEKWDKRIIKNSKKSFFTSEGFIKYHFSNKKISNCIIIPNKLNKEIQKFNYLETKREYDPENIQFGFVGGVRFESTIFFIEHIVKNYPQHTFHLFGIVDSKYEKRIELLGTLPNFINHGRFKNPNDLPKIYSIIDIVCCTYDVAYENVRYAEPNKLYESIYYRTPIIVSEGTYLASQVDKYNCGVSINPLETNSINRLIINLTKENYQGLKSSIENIDRHFALESNENLMTIFKNI